MSDITIKIHEGTGRLTGASLCRSCSNAFIREEACFGEIITCEATHPLTLIRGKVLKCNNYNNRGLPSLRDMRESAWTLRTEKGGKQMGFAPPKKADPDAPPDY